MAYIVAFVASAFLLLGEGSGIGFGIDRAGADEDVIVKFYPRFHERPDVFLRNLWNADTGSRGIMEDVTLIRSTRTYQPQDNMKRFSEVIIIIPNPGPFRQNRRGKTACEM